jgi:hypothetical protein
LEHLTNLGLRRSRTTGIPFAPPDCTIPRVIASDLNADLRKHGNGAFESIGWDSVSTVLSVVGNDTMRTILVMLFLAISIGAAEAEFELAEADPISFVHIMGACFPDMVREMIRDALAEVGMTEDDVRELIQKLEGTDKRH